MRKSSPGSGQITAPGASAPCQVIPLHGSRRYQVTGTPDATSWVWSSTPGLVIGEPDDAGTVEVTGQAASNAAGDQVLTVTIGATDSISLAITVVKVTSITTTIAATALPAAGLAAFNAIQPPVPDRGPVVFTSTETTEVFPASRDNTVLVLLRGSPLAVPLQADLTPPGIASWEAVRDPGDTLAAHHLQPALPTLTAGLGATATVGTDAAGAFAIRCYARCTCGQRHDDLKRVLRLVLVHAEITADRTAVSSSAFWAPGQVASLFDRHRNITDLITGAENLITLNADIRLISGGAQGRLYLGDPEDSAVTGFWCNTVRPPPSGADITGTYTNGRQVRVAYAAQLSRPHRAPPQYSDPALVTPIVPPLLDGSRDDGVGEPGDIKLAGSMTETSSTNNAPGWTLTATGEDLPNVPVPLYHPVSGTDTLTRVQLDTQFRAGLYLWSKSAPWVIGIAGTIDWGLAGDLSIQVTSENDDDHWAVPTVNAPLQTTRGPLTGGGQVRPADQAGICVWPPCSLNHLAMFTY